MKHAYSYDTTQNYFAVGKKKFIYCWNSLEICDTYAKQQLCGYALLFAKCKVIHKMLIISNFLFFKS